MYHKKIKRFSVNGVMKDDSDIPKTRRYMEETLEDWMRTEGYLPVRDLDSAWSTSWQDDKWTFKITMHGVYYGKRKAWEWDGVALGRLVPLSRQPMSAESSSH